MLIGHQALKHHKKVAYIWRGLHPGAYMWGVFSYLGDLLISWGALYPRGLFISGLLITGCISWLTGRPVTGGEGWGL